eukprot:scaffold20031_cov65-Phaeocystis_antarctica.AAC.15
MTPVRQPSSPDFERWEWSPSDTAHYAHSGVAARPLRALRKDTRILAQNPRERRIQGERTRSQSTITVRRAPQAHLQPSQRMHHSKGCIDRTKACGQILAQSSASYVYCVRAPNKDPILQQTDPQQPNGGGGRYLPTLFPGFEAPCFRNRNCTTTSQHTGPRPVTRTDRNNTHARRAR